MKFELRDMYRFLISHTFPGLLVLVEILLYLEWFAKLGVLCFLKKIWSTEAGNIIVFLILTYAFSTLLGIILDGTRHFFIEDLPRLWKKKEEKKFDAISDSMSMNAYKYFLDDDLWYPYEAYGNISFAMFPGFFFLWHWLSSIPYLQGWRFGIILVVYVVIFGLTVAETFLTYSQFNKDEEQFIKVYSARKAANPSKDD